MLGVNQKVTPLALRDRLTLDDAALSELLNRLRVHGVTEALALSTCDRVEILAHGDDPQSLRHRLITALCEAGAVDPAELAGAMVDLMGPAAVTHLFRIAAALESQVIGEPHILGQIKAAHRLSRDAGTAGSAVEAVLQAAYAAAKRVRTETAIAEGPVSLAAAAVQVARDLHGDLGRCTILMIGVQEMGELIAEQLLASGVSALVVCARRRRRAEALAARLGGQVADHDRLMEALAAADIVISGSAGVGATLGEEALKTALKRRRNQPMFVIDVGIPGTVEPAVERLEAAFLYDLADLEGVAERGRASRDEAARAAGALVQEAALAFVRDRAERRAVPAIIALRALFDLERRRVLDEAPDDAEKATRLLVGRLLHAPSKALRQMAAEGGEDPGSEKDRAEDLLRRLYNLEARGLPRRDGG